MGVLDGKVALVTGAARGLGEATARTFVAEGAQVVIGDILEERCAKVAADLGDAALFVPHDVGDEAQWQHIVDRTKEHFGRLDVLVNNAGILRISGLVDTSTEQYMEVFRTNQLGPFLGMRTAVPLMLETGGGSIVNISSTQGLTGMQGVISYVSSKFAVRGMTKTAAMELGGLGIRVNSVHPAGIETEMIDPEMIADLGEDAKARSLQVIPLGRTCKPAEIAQLVLWLASDASSYSTGAEFVADGGWTAGPIF